MKPRLLLLPCVLSLAALGALLGAPPAPTGRAALLATGLSDEQVIQLSANVAASGHPDPLLIDVPQARKALRLFLGQYRPDRVTPVGTLPRGLEEMRRELGGWVQSPLEWRPGPLPESLWKLLFPKAEEVVVCPAGPRPLLLQAACLAGAVRAPLYVLHGTAGEDAELRRRLDAWGTRKVYAVGEVFAAVRGALPAENIVSLADEEDVANAYLERLADRGPVETLVVANPADALKGRLGMSTLAAYVAVEHRAPLLLTSPRGDDAADRVRAALKKGALRRAANLILVGDRRAVPPERRKNPLPGADQLIELEPPGPGKDEPFSLATGRMFHKDPGVLLLMMARARQMAQETGPRRALVVTNPDGGLPLLETISRNTAKELANAGYKTDAYFNRQGNPALVRRLLPHADIFLWEGHLGTLNGWGVPRWTEPMRPSLVFLQSCLALTEPNAYSFLERGAVGVIGSPARTYSATGGALTLAYFDALLYDGQSVGGSLRQAKNFLLAYARLKEQRLGGKSRLGGANVRSAWAFSLWGDPTVTLPRTKLPDNALPRVRPEVVGSRIVLSLPPGHYPKVDTGRYQVTVWPNGRLGGLITRDENDRKTLVPLLFAEVHLKGHAPKRPRLTSRLPADRWVFLWDGRLQRGYWLSRPRGRDREEVRFQVAWEE